MAATEDRLNRRLRAQQPSPSPSILRIHPISWPVQSLHKASGYYARLSPVPTPVQCITQDSLPTPVQCITQDSLPHNSAVYYARLPAPHQCSVLHKSPCPHQCSVLRKTPCPTPAHTSAVYYARLPAHTSAVYYTRLPAPHQCTQHSSPVM